MLYWGGTVAQPLCVPRVLCGVCVKHSTIIKKCTERQQLKLTFFRLRNRQKLGADQIWVRIRFENIRYAVHITNIPLQILSNSARTAYSVKQLGYKVDNWDLIVLFRQKQEIFLFIKVSGLVLGATQPTIQQVLRVKCPGCDSDHSLPPSVENENE